MFAFAVLAVMLGTTEGGPSTDATAAAESKNRPWELSVGVTGGIRSGGLGAVGSGIAALDYKVGSYFRPEIQVGLGAYGAPFELGSRLRVGTRIEYPRDGVVPYVWIAFAHQHESTWTNVRSDPVPLVLGLSENGVNHRSGGEVGLGLSYDIPRFGLDWLAGRLSVRATVTDLLGVGPPLYAELLTSLGVCF